MSAFTVRCKAGLKKEKHSNRRPAHDTPKPPSRIARMLALAHLVEQLIEQSKVKNYTDAARRLGISRARMTQ